jgi:hypothetical protein
MHVKFVDEISFVLLIFDQKKENKTTNNNPLNTTHKTEEQHQPHLR